MTPRRERNTFRGRLAARRLGGKYTGGSAMRANAILFALVLPLLWGFSDWQVFKDDDGTLDSIWGFCGAPGQVLCKTFVLESVTGASDAMVHYEIGANPYHYKTKEYPAKPQDGVAWNDMLILVNDVEAVRGSPMELGVKGWHKVRFDPKLLKAGENTVKFTWAKGPEDGGGGFYLGIDTATHKRRSSSSPNGKDFTFDCLRQNGAEPSPQWQGEYMVRLLVAFAPPRNAVAARPNAAAAVSNPGEWQAVFSDDFNRSDVFGPDWVAKDGKWDVRGNLRANGPGAVMMCTHRFEAPFRIEYECYSDNPCDLSLEFRKKLEDKSVCFVGFGAENNTRNKIDVPGEGAVAVSKDKLIEVGRKHKLVVTVGDDGTLSQTVDGQDTLKATVSGLPKRLYFGFYVWNQGVFNTVKVFSPHAGGEPAAAKKTAAPGASLPAVRQFESFNSSAVGDLKAPAVQVESGTNCSVKIADAPTWLYCFAKFSDQWRTYDENADPSVPVPDRAKTTNKGARFVPDPCVELLDVDAAPAQHAAATFSAPEMRQGLFEFDLMADQYAGDGLRVRLGEKTGLWIDKDGQFWWESGTQSTKLLERVQMYPSIRGMTRFYLRPQRWFTVRIDFDLDMSLANVAIVRMFTGIKCQQTEYLSVGEDLPLPLDAIKAIRFETCGQGRFLIDNLFMVSRTEDLADDQKWRVPARQMMPAYYPLRKDPFHLRNWSMHNIRFMEGSGCPSGDEIHDLLQHPDQYPVILGCAAKYNRIMIRQAFLAEKMRGLERAWCYAAPLLGDEYRAKVDAARQATANTETLLGELYEFYAACYLDRLNQEAMQAGFDPRHAALTAALEAANTAIQTTLEQMRAEVVKRSGCRFAPYVIETAEARCMKPRYADGAFRGPDGKKEFVFARAFYWLWPSMEEILMFSPLVPVSGEQRMIGGAKEPEYCDSSADSWFHTCMTRRPQEQVALRISCGLHNHESMLPEWWYEQHKSDPDILLQNSQGQSATGNSRPYNYWHPAVQAAQKATFEGLGDVIVKYGWQDRVAYLDLAQEAYFPITAPGGTWESGYNLSAVNAFRARLRASYGTIEALNARWGSKYGSFDEIKPPEDWRLKPEPVPGLTCEFERFRQDSWHTWLKQCRQSLSAKLGRDVPSSCQITYNGDNCTNGLDWARLFETFSVVMEHYSQQFEQEPLTYRYLENLREAYKTTTGIGEWYVSGLGDLFDEQNIRNNGLRQAYQQAQWGRAVLVYWQAHDFMFLHNGNATENRLGHTVLRYHAAYIPLSIARAQAHRAIYLDCPLVQPDVGILESDNSFYNVCGVRGGGGEFGSLLFRQGHNYGNLFERLLMDGRQSLDGYKVVILPNAACLPDAFVTKLLAWVKAGGVLITTGATGVMNEYGVKGGTFPDAVLGAGQWTYAKGLLAVRDGAPGLRVAAQDSSNQPALIEKASDKGKVYMRLNPVKEDVLYGIIASHAPRQFYGKQNRFHLAMRDGKAREGTEKGALYLTALNPDCFERFEDEIVLAGEYREVADIGSNFPIIPEIKNGQTSFKISLAPAEPVVIRIRP